MASAGDPTILTVGHSNTSLDHLLSLLRMHRIEVVADVRTYPKSRYVPHFDAAPLQQFLNANEIGYVAMGEQLGGRPRERDYYDSDGFVRYDRLADTGFFNAGMKRLISGGSKYRVAVLCSEENPLTCHRYLLISRVLTECSVSVAHIRHDGRLVGHDSLQDVPVGNGTQTALFESRCTEWKSAHSVLRRSPPAPSSTSSNRPE